MAELKRFEIYYRLQGGNFGREIADQKDVTPDINGLISRYPNLQTNRSASLVLFLNTVFGFLIEYGVLKNASVVAQFRGYTLDLNGNGIYNSGELLSEIAGTWRMKF